MAVQRARDITPHAPVAIDDPRIEYPSSDGEPLAESDHQYIPLTDTVSTLRNHYRDRTDVYVAGDMLVYYVLNDPSTSVAPDVYAVFGTLGNHPRDSWVVSREGGRVPDFVLEVASRSTWRRDREEKREIYADIGVSEYWRFDPLDEFFSLPLEAERLVDGAYQPIPIRRDEDGVLRAYSEVLGLELCVFADLSLRLHDPLRGVWLLNHQRSEEARLASEAELEREREGRLAAEARLRLLEAQLRASD
jgi:Uma2 family endonuclease